MLGPTDVTEIDNIPVTTLARTLLDLAAVLSQRELARAIDRAERLDLLDLREIDDVLSRARGRRGAKALRHAVAAWRPRFTRQELEDRFQDLIESNHVPRPQTNVLVDGDTQTWEVDAYWPQFNLVVELDGFAHHRTRMDLERDAAKTADLELAGKRVVRLSWDEVTVHARRTLRRLQALRR